MTKLNVINGDSIHTIWTYTIPRIGDKINIKDEKFEVEDLEYQITKNATEHLSATIHIRKRNIRRSYDQQDKDAKLYEPKLTNNKIIGE